MKVVFVIDNYNSFTDGTAMSARRFYDKLTSLGHEVRVVSFDLDKNNPYGLKEHKIPIVSWVSHKSNIIFAKYKKSVLKSALEGADAVHLFLPFQVQRKTLALARKMKIPVCAAHHLHPENITKNAGVKKTPHFLRSLVFFWWRKSLFDLVDNIHCPSQFIADELKKHKYKGDMHIISNGVSDCFVPSKERLERINSPIPPAPFGQNGKKLKILMTGRYANEKRQDVLIDAVLNSPYAKDIHITFAGMGPQKSRLMAHASKLPLKADFCFFNQDELIKKINESDLYIHAADIEVEGISCIEAFSCGLVPVIGNAKRSATKQFAIDKRCSFNAGDPKSLQERIDYWFNNPNELNNMSKKYIEYSKEFEIDHAVDKIVEMFEKTIHDDYFRYVNILKEKKKLLKAMKQSFNKTLELPDLLALNAKEPFDPNPNAHLADPDPFLLTNTSSNYKKLD